MGSGHSGGYWWSGASKERWLRRVRGQGEAAIHQ